MRLCPLLEAGTLTLEPDGTATGCNPVEVGSTPTGVSEEFDCRLRLHLLGERTRPGQALAELLATRGPTACRDYITGC